MLWVLKRTVSSSRDGSFEHPKQKLKTDEYIIYDIQFYPPKSMGGYLINTLIAIVTANDLKYFEVSVVKCLISFGSLNCRKCGPRLSGTKLFVHAICYFTLSCVADDIFFLSCGEDFKGPIEFRHHGHPPKTNIRTRPGLTCLYLHMVCQELR